MLSQHRSAKDKISLQKSESSDEKIIMGNILKAHIHALIQSVTFFKSNIFYHLLIYVNMYSYFAIYYCCSSK